MAERATSCILPLVEWVEPFNTHIYRLYVQIATEMHWVDGVGGFGGGPRTWTTWEIPSRLMKHTCCAIHHTNASVQD